MHGQKDILCEKNNSDNDKEDEVKDISTSYMETNREESSDQYTIPTVFIAAMVFIY